MPQPPFIRSSDGTVRQGKTVSAANTPALQLDGKDLTSIEDDVQTRLKFGEITVAIGTPFRLTIDNQPQTLDFETPGTLRPLLAIYPATVLSAKVMLDLTLRLEFTSGVVIEVPEDPAFEAWEISGPGSRFIVCPPAGGHGLSVWL